ncbi:MAG TPA: sigma-70 family RNA polymerase sigma factor [Bryobacteraceae bacterium]|nr:sigma-70 family RNA polymerase sigma factor [Bryobacteraceae bacterium]
MSALSDAAGGIGAGEAAVEFEQAFHLHYGRVARTIARIVRDPARAEELAVEVFWKLWQRPEALGEDVGGWLYRTGVHAALYDLRREQRRARYHRLFPFLGAPATPEQAHAAAEECTHVRAVLARMNARQAELLLLRGDDLSYRQVAEALGLNPASVGTLLSRAQQAFRKEYLKHYGKPRK